MSSPFSRSLRALDSEGQQISPERACRSRKCWSSTMLRAARPETMRLSLTAVVARA